MQVLQQKLEKKKSGQIAISLITTILDPLVQRLMVLWSPRPQSQPQWTLNKKVKPQSHQTDHN